MNETPFELLKEWCDTLLSLQVREISDPRLRGAILCPSCGVIHGRCADLVYPLTVLYRETREDKYALAAELLSDWVEANLKNDMGLYYNDFDNGWFGISAFACDSLYEALVAGKDVLPARIYEKFRERFIDLSDAVYAAFSAPSFKPVLNYHAGGAMAMTERYLLTGEEKYRTLALEKIQVCLESITPDGLMAGESNEYKFDDSPGGFKSVDIGYNLEETIPFLLKIARYLDDPALMEKAAEAAETAVFFLLPDGAIDNSFGSRSAKWTYAGSRTSDGMQPGLILCPDHPALYEAAWRNFDCMRRQTYRGLLSGGARYQTAGEYPCVHHAFSHAKALAAMVGKTRGEAASLPCDTFRGLRSFASVGVDKIGTREFLASVYYGDVSYEGKLVPLGGTITLLYHRKLGVLMAGTPGRYYPVEPKNMQAPVKARGVECMTMRLCAGPYSSVFNGQVWHKAVDTSVTVHGAMCDAKDRSAENGGYRFRYDFTDDSVMINVISECDADLILPITAEPGDTIAAAGGGALIRREKGTVYLSCTDQIGFAHEGDEGSKRYFHPVGGFMYTVFRIPVKAGRKTSVTITVK